MSLYVCVTNYIFKNMREKEIAQSGKSYFEINLLLSNELFKIDSYYLEPRKLTKHS